MRTELIDEAAPARAAKLPLLACSMGAFLVLFFTTLTTVGVPRIRAEFGAGFSAGQWTINAYSLAIAAFLIPAGSIGDRFGHRRLLLTGLGLLGAGTLGGAVSPAVGALIAGRAVQGVGGAAVLAACVPLLLRRYDGARRGWAFSVWGAVTAIGSVVGTVSGGPLVEAFGWRVAFGGGVLLMVACGLAAAVAFAADPPRERRAPERLDGGGAVAAAVCMGSVTLAAIDAGEHGWLSVRVGVVLAVGVLAAAAFTVVETRVPNPMVPSALLRNRRFAGVCLLAFGYYFAAFACLPAIAEWLTTDVGWSSATAAAMISAQMVGYIAATFVAARLLRRYIGSVVLMMGTGCIAGSAVLVIAFGLTAAVPLVCGIVVVTGAGAGLASPALPMAATESVGDRDAGVAGAITNAMRQLGLAVGVAVCGSLAHSAHGWGSGPSGALAVALIVAASVAAFAVVGSRAAGVGRRARATT